MTDRLQETLRQSCQEATTESTSARPSPHHLRKWAQGPRPKAGAVGMSLPVLEGLLQRWESASACHRDGVLAAGVLEGAPWR